MIFRWAAVKRREINGDISYDVWQWNLFKLKWVRLSQTACGFYRLSDAKRVAKQLSDEIDRMFESNRQPPASPSWHRTPA